MVFIAIVGLLVAGLSTAYVVSPDVRFLTRAGAEETEILASRRPIDRMVNDPATDPDLRARLKLVIDVRNYADSLGFSAGKTYTTYADVKRDTLLLVISASPKDCLCPYTWKYPIVGRMPYKGFFDLNAARKEAAKLDGKGYDTWVRPSGAFSTLGWFDDPLLSTAVGGDTVELVATVFHEISHNTLYVKSATPFNESFAQLVGYRAAESFFRSRGDTAAARHAAERWEDEIILGGYYAILAARLDTLYRSAKGDSVALDQGRATIAAWARSTLQDSVAPRLKTYQVGRLPERPVNNARIIAARIYRDHLDLFEAWYDQHYRDIGQSVAALRDLMKGAEGDSAVARLQAAVRR
ncbi:MAG TPA: aminopeptidase [Gemmatimonadales bacterium]|nr:aminopeptidase [Gemmatimonadales bacterium]